MHQFTMFQHFKKSPNPQNKITAPTEAFLIWIPNETEFLNYLKLNLFHMINKPLPPLQHTYVFIPTKWLANQIKTLEIRMCPSKCCNQIIHSIFIFNFSIILRTNTLSCM